MLTGFEYDPVNSIFVKRKNSRCPPNAVTFGNGQNNALNLLFTVVRVHKDCAMILAKPVIACPATKQTGLVFAVPCTGGNVSFPLDFIV